MWSMTSSCEVQRIVTYLLNIGGGKGNSFVCGTVVLNTPYNEKNWNENWSKKYQDFTIK